MRVFLTTTLFLLLLNTSPLFGDNHKSETLYRWGEYPKFVWKEFGDKETHPKYNGEVDESGKPSGRGVLIFPNGKKYHGEWKDGLPNGQGTFITHDGDKYIGGFKNGNEHGQGTYTWTNGDSYEGEFMDQKPNGQGTYTFFDGDDYKGEFINGEPNGQGTYTFSSGDKFVGEMKGWNTWNGIGYDKFGSIKVKFVNGKQIKQ